MKSVLLFTLCYLSQFAFSQNLLPNPSFEESNTCYKYQEKCSPKGWRPTTLKGIRYNEFLGNRHKVKPPDGNRYISLIMHNAKKANERKFIQAPLLCPLLAGKSYTFSLYFKTQTTIVHQFAIYFPEELNILKNNLPLFQVAPQIVFNCDKNMAVNQWHKLEGSFIATGNEQGIIVGNFFSDEQTTTSLLKKLTKKQLKENPPRVITYYSFDHFSLTAQDTSTSDCELRKNLAFIYQDTTRHIISEKPKIIADLPMAITTSIEAVFTDSIITKPKTSVPFVEERPIESSFVLENVLFENNSAVLLPLAHSALNQLLNTLRNHPTYRLSIIGHTDDIGKASDNLYLSQQRAQSVAQFFIKNGIPSSRLEASGKGETEPIASNLNAIGRGKNRRVEFFLLKE